MEQCLSNLPEQPIIIRLSGWVQHNDRMAMREIAYQLTQQTGTSFLTPDEDEEDEDILPAAVDDADEDAGNPFVDASSTSAPPPTLDNPPTHLPGSLPPASHLPALISLIPTLPRPTIILLDAFDLFAQHPRQSLLYCLLDTVQSLRAGTATRGMAVVGITTRVDTVTMLEKRVKSRFSGRTVRTGGAQGLTEWIGAVRDVLSVPVSTSEEDETEHKEWRDMWTAGVENFMADAKVEQTLHETFSITKDVRVLIRILVGLIPGTIIRIY